MNFEKYLDLLINKFHILLATTAQAAVLAYQFKTGHDIGPGIQNSLYGYFAFLAGHALTYQKYPDASDVKIPTP